MTGTSWVLKGTEYGNCNCDYGCPCQFNGRPSSADGSCRYATFTQIDEGHYGEVVLNGLNFGECRPSARSPKRQTMPHMTKG
jgi:hypothetical protein